MTIRKAPTQSSTRRRSSTTKAVSAAWQLQSAKARFSEVFRLARSSGPQFVTRGGRDAVVVIPVEEYEALIGKSQQPKSLVDFFRASPLAGLDLNLDRDRDLGREVKL